MSSELARATRAAAARNRLRSVGRIVVGQLFTLPDIARRADPDRLAYDLGVAVRFARVVDVARDVPADGGVPDVQPIELEAPDVTSFQVSDLALQTLPVGDLLPGIVDDALVLGNRLGSKNPPAFNF